MLFWCFKFYKKQFFATKYQLIKIFAIFAFKRDINVNLMIKQDKRNYRKHSDKNKQIINKSLTELGAGRSILIDADNEIIAGNGVHSQWGDKSIRIIESDGSELIAIKRTDLHTDDYRMQKLDPALIVKCNGIKI